MNWQTIFRSRTLGLGGLALAAALLGWAPSCRAQEVNPTHFTETGIEEFYPAASTPAKNGPKAQTVRRAKSVGQRADATRTVDRSAARRVSSKAGLEPGAKARSVRATPRAASAKIADSSASKSCGGRVRCEREEEHK
jgi:hypothetical protein